MSEFSDIINARILMKRSSKIDGFTTLEDGTIYVRAGTQTNCAGFAAIVVKITRTETKDISFKISSRPGEHENGFGWRVPGWAIPEEFKEMILEGAKEAFNEEQTEVGIEVELLSAHVHQVDAREDRFKAAGYKAVRGWFESNNPD